MHESWTCEGEGEVGRGVWGTIQLKVAQGHVQEVQIMLRRALRVAKLTYKVDVPEGSCCQAG